jgi:hypothetical protein
MIIACCMLDSLPMLRIRGPSPSTVNAGLVNSDCDAAVASGAMNSNPAEKADKIHGGKAGYVQRMKGGNVSHIGKNK